MNIDVIFEIRWKSEQRACGFLGSCVAYVANYLQYIPRLNEI